MRHQMKAPGKIREVIAFAIYFFISLGLLFSPNRVALSDEVINHIPIHTQPEPAAESVPQTTQLPAKPKAKTTKLGGIASSSQGNIGIFITSSPSDPNSLRVLDWAAGAGMNIVYNYTPFDGSVDQVNHYLDYAGSKGIKVIFSLHNLYDQHPEAGEVVQNYSQYGQTPEAIALNVVRQFQAHSAVWGFSLTDEKPEGLGDLNNWKPVLADRQAKIKALTSKPTMAVLVGWSSGQSADRRNLLSNVKQTSDHLALDYYPIPFLPLDRTTTINQELAQYDASGWSIIQNFSWSSYPATAAALGFNVGSSRYPTTDEMIDMAHMALGAGARNILFYSYFDIKNNPGQQNAVSQAVHRLISP